MNYGNTRIGGKSIFSSRKTRSNKGVPRKPLVAAPSNVVIVNAGGVAHIHKPRKVRSNKGKSRPGSKTYARQTAVAFAALPGLNVSPMYTAAGRKVRSNKGTVRNPASKRQKTLRLRQLARNVLGLSRVPRKGTMARSTINQML